MSLGSKFPIVLTVAGGLAAATTGSVFAAPVPSNSVAVKASAPVTATQVRYRSHVERPYQGYGSDPYWGYLYGGPQYSYPAYAYPSYSYWGYPAYSYGGIPPYGYAYYGW
jgi:hypothetical protein